MRRLIQVLIFLITTYFFPQDILLENFGPVFTEPVEIKNCGDDRLFVVEKAGIIKILNPDGTVEDTPFLNIVSLVNSASSEMGLLGLAFHPNYPLNPNFYINYINLSGDTVIAKYSVSPDPNIANTTETILLTIDQPYANHNGGCIQFGPDGYLYIATGDGGSGGDPENRAQDLNTLLGKLLRIDIDGAAPYGIPIDNPYLNDGDDTTLPEIWAYGLRNPWKFTFDSTTDNLWITDVGQDNFEEINTMPSTESGLNYGWRCYEASSTYNTTDCPEPSSLTFPVSEYTHQGNGINRCSITGGYVYRGTEQPGFQGKYFFADYCSQEIGILTESEGAWNYTFSDPFPDNNWVTFGEDHSGELYIAERFNGNLYKIVEDNLSVDESENLEIEIYPNPTNDYININFNDQDSLAYTVKFYSIQGKIINEFNGIESEIFTISTLNIQNGFYIVEIIKDTGEKQLKKIVIN